MKDLVRKGWLVAGAAIVVDPWTVERRESLHIRDRNGLLSCLTMVWRDKSTLYLIHAACPLRKIAHPRPAALEDPDLFPRCFSTPPQFVPSVGPARHRTGSKHIKWRASP